MWDALAPLGIELDDGGDSDTLVAVPPTFRPDLEREIDLVEEVARRIGFARIGRTLPDTHGQVGALTRRQRERRLVADALVGFGMSEAITLPLVSPADLDRAGAPLDRVVRASNPLRAEESVLRTRILAGLLRAVQFNRSHGLADVALFEMGHVFAAPATTDGPLPDEPEHVALALAGSVRRRPIEDDREVDVYDAVDAVHVLADALDVAGLDFDATDVGGFRPGRATRVVVGGSELGVVGEVAGEVLDALGLEPPVVAAELSLDALFGASRRERTFRTPSRFPTSTVDLAFAVDEAVPATRLQQTMRDAVGEVLEDVRAFDDFRSDALGSGPPEPRVRVAVPRARPNPHRRRRRRAPTACDRRGHEGARRASCADAVFVHHIRPRYAEVDAQGVVFNAHWLTYFDETQTRFFEWLGLRPKEVFFTDFDVMVVKAVLEWQGPAGFDDDVSVTVAIPRIGNASFDLEYDASCNGSAACVGVITYVSVIPGTHDSTPIPDHVRKLLTDYS